MSKKQKPKPKTAKSKTILQEPKPLVDPGLVLAPSPSELKLDLGCGQNPREGFDGVDLYGDKAKHKVDLFKFPWPFADNSVDEIHCSHFMEHIPSREVEERDLSVPARDRIDSEVLLPTPHAKMLKADSRAAQFLGQDMLFAFMDECYRILKTDAWMHVVVPSGRSNRAFWDPTHRRFFMQETFLYFNADWRKMNGLDHYRTKAHFGVDVGQTVPAEEGLRSADVQAQRFQTLWNVTVDWIAKLKKLL
jgi:predicted SAM-dependent methyltransferase